MCPSHLLILIRVPFSKQTARPGDVTLSKLTGVAARLLDQGKGPLIESSGASAPDLNSGLVKRPDADGSETWIH
jgi:hypothetical protein